MLSVGANVVNVVITEIVMVRLQGDFAKPPEKRFNYKHCFDALFRVSRSIPYYNLPCLAIELAQG
jgi:hypothetical protein